MVHFFHDWQLVGTVHDGLRYSDIPDLCNPWYDLYECALCGKRKRVLRKDWVMGGRDVDSEVARESYEWVKGEGFVK